MWKAVKQFQWEIVNLTKDEVWFIIICNAYGMQSWLNFMTGIGLFNKWITLSHSCYRDEFTSLMGPILELDDVVYLLDGRYVVFS